VLDSRDGDDREEYPSIGLKRGWAERAESPPGHEREKVAREPAGSAR
jgi:hypothetical protein